MSFDFDSFLLTRVTNSVVKSERELRLLGKELEQIKVSRNPERYRSLLL